MITLDTSGLLAIVNDKDSRHASAMAVIRSRPDPLVIPAPILSEFAFLMESRGHARRLARFLEEIGRGRTVLDCCESDFPRIGRLMERYGDLRLGFSDAWAIACAERNGGLVLTFDDRHFGTVAREGTIRPLPGFGSLN